MFTLELTATERVPPGREAGFDKLSRRKFSRWFSAERSPLPVLPMSSSFLPTPATP
jgi:hypothetical protein